MAALSVYRRVGAERFPSTCWIKLQLFFFFFFLKFRLWSNVPWLTRICVQRGQRNTRLWMGPYGRMRFHRETLSASRCFKTPEPWPWSGLPLRVKNPLRVCLSHCGGGGAAAGGGCCCCFAPSVCQSVKWLWCGGISRSSPLTLPHPLITHPSIYLSPHPSIHPFLHVSPTGFQMFVSSLSPSTSLPLSLSLPLLPSFPPPPSALVATETADSGRVGGCLRALAALPHAVLSQYISASVLLLWPRYADSSGGSVRCYTIVSTAQRLFVLFPQRTCSLFRVALPFMFSWYERGESLHCPLTNHKGCREIIFTGLPAEFDVISDSDVCSLSVGLILRDFKPIFCLNIYDTWVGVTPRWLIM